MFCTFKKNCNDLYLFHFIVLSNPDFNCSKSSLPFPVAKVTTGTYSFVSAILNSNPVGATIAGGSLLNPTSLTARSAETQFLNQVLDQFYFTINQWHIQSSPKFA